jgi:hypothetical protein
MIEMYVNEILRSGNLRNSSKLSNHRKTKTVIGFTRGA